MLQSLLSFIVFLGLFALLNAKLLSLTPSSFNEQINSPVPTLVAFIAPWCGHCQRAKPELEKAAQSLGGVVHIATVDCEEHKEMASRYQIQGFPTIKMFSNKGKSVDDYNGQRSARDFSNYALQYLKKLSDPVRKLADSEIETFLEGDSEKTRVVLATEKDSNPALFKSIGIEFLESNIDFAVILQAEKHANLLEKINISKFPTIFFVHPTKDEAKERVTIYTGPLKKYSILEEVKKYSKSGQKTEEKKPTIKHTIQRVKDIQSWKDIESHCKNLCILGFGEETHKELFSSIAKKHSEQSHPFLFIESKKYADITKKLGLDEMSNLFLVALRLKRNRFARSAAVVEDEDADRFLERISYGDAKYEKLPSTLHNEL